MDNDYSQLLENAKPKSNLNTNQSNINDSQEDSNIENYL